MRRYSTILIFLIAIMSSCTEKFSVPVMGDYSVYEVDIKELSGLCLSADRTSLIACGDKGVVKSVSFDGRSKELWVSASDMEGVTINPSDGNIYLAIEGEQEIHVLSAPTYDRQNRLFAVEEALAYGNSGLEAVEFFADDILFVGSQKEANLWRYKLDGTLLSKISLSAFASEIAGLCYDSESECIWVTDSKQAKMFVCSIAGELLATYDLSFVDNAESICIDRKRDCIWVGSDEDNTKLYKINFRF